MFKRLFVAVLAYLATLRRDNDPPPPGAPADPDRDELFGPLVRRRNFSTDLPGRAYGRNELVAAVQAATFQKTVDHFRALDGAFAMDAMEDFKAAFQMNGNGMSDIQLSFFASQAFIGFQSCAMLAQNWLIMKACSTPARDAVRAGYELTVNDGTKIGPEVLAEIRRFDKRVGLRKNLREFVTLGRVFGIRVLLFDVVSTDPEYYSKPFNPDGVTPGSYRGMVQIDPYWMAPELSGQAAANPTSKEFFEPTFWNINGKRYHRSHLAIFRGDEVPDILKPTYLYAGLSVPQKIYERVYASERTANEAPQLALTKRTNVRKVDVDKAVANPEAFEEKLQAAAYYRDNYGIQVIGLDEEATQLDTSLSDLDVVIMSQYQLVAAAANVPVTKLLGTTPKGFNATGEFDEASYHEELESIQEHDLSPLLERHYLLAVRSHIAPKFSTQPFEVDVAWKPLDAMTASELADVNLKKAQTDQALQAAGAIDGEDIRARITADQDSGYSGLALATPEELPPEDEDDEPVAPAAADTDPAPSTNAAIQNLSGKQFQGVARIIRNYSKGSLSRAQAAVMLRSGFALNDQEVGELLGEAASNAEAD